MTDQGPTDRDKVAIVTGSAMNIGRAIALHLARDGFRILVTARQAQHDAQDTARMVQEAGGQAVVHMADITDPAQAKGLIEAAMWHFGRLDVLVNNASVRRQTKFTDMTPEEWREIMSATLDGAFYCAHAAAGPIAKAGGGSIINLGGISAHVGAVGRVHAVTAKAGMVGLTRALAKELAGDNITVNTVVPGSIETIRGAAAGGNHGRSVVTGKPDRPTWPARRDRCNGAVPVLAGSPLRDRTNHPRKWRRIHAMIGIGNEGRRVTPH